MTSEDANEISPVSVPDFTEVELSAIEALISDEAPRVRYEQAIATLGFQIRTLWRKQELLQEKLGTDFESCDEAKASGYEDGYEAGEDAGYSRGFADGEDEGYARCQRELEEREESK